MSMRQMYKIAIIGDSNTQGHGIEAEETYAHLLNLTLHPLASVHNFGVSGSCVMHKKLKDVWLGMPYLEESACADACALKADLYVINLGTNDATDGLSESEDQVDPYGNIIAHKDDFEKSYQKLIDRVKALQPEKGILLCIPIPIRKSAWRKHRQSYLETLVPHIQRLASDNELPILDLMSPFLALNAIDQYYLEDGLHLNPRGAALVSDILSKVLINMIKS